MTTSDRTHRAASRPGPSAIVIGAGPNGLVAANVLAERGWSVQVLEAQDTPGGAVRSDRSLHPDFVHDTFSAFYPLAVASPVITSLHLDRFGLEWDRAPAALGHPLPDGSWALVHDSVEATAAHLDETSPGDGDAWLRLCAIWSRVGTDLVDAVTRPFPPVRPGLRLLAKARSAGGLQFARMLIEPVTVLAETWFRGPQARLLLMGNAGHSDIPLDAPGSGLMGLLLAMLAQFNGFPVPRGGAQQLTEALSNRLDSFGGTIRTGAHVDRVLLDGRRVRGVLVGGERLAADAVVATCVAPHLYGSLLPDAELPRRVVRGMRGFRLDPGTVKVDWALSGVVPWRSNPPHAPGTVHIADSPDDLVSSLQQLAAHRVPAKPFLLAGQMTTTDPTRSPAGTESMWAYTHVPQQIAADAGGDGDADIRGTWDDADCQRMADRMQQRIERLAPGFSDLVLARRVLGPRELEGRDENLIGGAINGGTSSLQQQLVFRPVPGLGRAETPFAGLYLGSASAHPGGGVHGAAGANAARAAIFHHRLRRH